MIVCIENDWRYADFETRSREYIEPNVPPHGYGQRGGYPIPREVRDKEGNRCCRWCFSPVTPPRRTWCSKDCVDDANTRRNWKVIVDEIRKRDQVCQICGGTSYRGGSTYREQKGYEDIPYRDRPLSTMLSEYFEVDHIIAVHEGGTDHPDNLRLLCRGCHKEVTAEQKRRWANQKNPQNQLEF